MINEILVTSNSMFGESALPDFSFAAENRSEGMRVATFEELDGVFERHVVGGG